MSQKFPLDISDVYGSVKTLPDQCRHAWEEVEKITLPADYRDVNKIVMAGMGGSGLAARVVESLNLLPHPLTRINDYNLPSWVDQQTLVICSSYSGNTEETVSNLTQALDKKAKVIVVAAAGKLLEISRDKNLPFYQIVPKFNPSNQPRMAIGYSIVGQLALLCRAGLLSLKKEDFVFTPVDETEAENFSAKLVNKQIVFVTAGHLTGAFHVVKNQLNENAKTIGFREDLPELNHHLMEGLRFPESNKNLIFWFALSNLFSEKMKKRLKLTEEVVSKNGVATINHELQTTSQIAQVFELIQFGAMTIFHLTMRNGIDPAPIPWVDYFKQKLLE